MIDFDDIDDWSPKLFNALKDNISAEVASAIAATSHKYDEDACKMLFELADRDAIIDETLAWIRSETMVAYHGTRLIDADIASVLAKGLLPVKAETRRERLVRALCGHRCWSRVASRLDAALDAEGPGNPDGHREGQVHLTLSRSGLTESFNHYIARGSEFDQKVARALLGTEGLELLDRDGKPRLIHVGVPGGGALEGAHPYFDIETTRDREGVPNVVKEFLRSWACRLANPIYQSRSEQLDCGLIFRETVPKTWIMKIETLPD